MTHPKTYCAAQFQKKGGDLVLVDVDWKDPEPNQLVLKTSACGVCHSDGIVQNQLMPTGFPRIPGHEIVGKVVAVGSQVKSFKVGDTGGSGWHGGHCFACRSCKKGDFVTCENENVNGIMTDGGYAEYVTLRAEAVLHVPEDMDPVEVAPLLCAGVTTFNSLRHMNVHPGDVVAVQGVGGLGHLALQFASKMGYRTVALSQSASKASLAKELGAHDYLDASKVNQVEELNKMGGAKVIIAVAPSGKAISEMLPALAVDGTLVILALSDELTVPPAVMISKRLNIRGWPSGTAQDSQETIEFAKLADIKCYTEAFTLDQCNEAYKKMNDNKVRFRAVLKF